MATGSGGWQEGGAGGGVEGRVVVVLLFGVRVVLARIEVEWVR